MYVRQISHAVEFILKLDKMHCIDLYQEWTLSHVIGLTVVSHDKV